MIIQKTEKGIVLTWAIVSAVIFLILVGGLLSFVLMEQKYSTENAAYEEALHIAEGGVNYYKWLLNKHATTTQEDVQNGNTWCTSSDTIAKCGSLDWCGPYIYDYKDTNGSVVGRHELCTKPKKICDQILAVQLKSTGYKINTPNVKRSLLIKFAATTIADYAYMIEDNVWAGADREIHGKYHANGGVKMDGSGNSLVTSGSDTWLCGSSYGCNYNNCPSGCARVATATACRCPGVFGDGLPNDLWKSGVTRFNFAGITSGLQKIKDLANAKGRYYGPSTTTDSSADGYHIVFNSDGTFDVRIVTEIDNIYSTYNDGATNTPGWYPEKIRTEYNYKTNVTTTDDCGLIFLEDNVWVEGTVKGRKTLASANLIDSSVDTSAILNWNIDYTALDGSDSFALIAEKDVSVPLCSPGGNSDNNNFCKRSGNTGSQMTVRGVYVAQKGRFGRNYYPSSVTQGRKTTSYSPWYLRNTMMIYGTIVSSKRVGTKWTCGWGYCSGYADRFDYFDQRLSKDPPPMLPYVSPDLQIVSWEELQ